MVDEEINSNGWNPQSGRYSYIKSYYSYHSMGSGSGGLYPPKKTLHPPPGIIFCSQPSYPLP